VTREVAMLLVHQGTPRDVEALRELPEHRRRHSGRP